MKKQLLIISMMFLLVFVVIPTEQVEADNFEVHISIETYHTEKATVGMSDAMWEGNIFVNYPCTLRNIDIWGGAMYGSDYAATDLAKGDHTTTVIFDKVNLTGIQDIEFIFGFDYTELAYWSGYSYQLVVILEQDFGVNPILNSTDYYRDLDLYEHLPTTLITQTINTTQIQTEYTTRIEIVEDITNYTWLFGLIIGCLFIFLFFRWIVNYQSKPLKEKTEIIQKKEDYDSHKWYSDRLKRVVSVDKCKACNQDNHTGSIYCVGCGTMLGVSKK